jgi:phytol kinase
VGFLYGHESFERFECYTKLMLLRLIVACFFVGSAILFAEVARANKWVSGERARKIIHILVGIWGAWLPLWLGWRSIMLLGILLLAGVAFANNQRWFKSIHSVNRSTVGEYLFPITMILLAVFFKNEVIFAASMLQLGLADGLAAVIGTRYGKKTGFKVMGQRKSRHGTVTFFVCSTLITFWALIMMNSSIAGTSGAGLLVTLLLSAAFGGVLTAAELTGVRGVDNVSVPILSAVGLSLLK